MHAQEAGTKKNAADEQYTIGNNSGVTALNMVVLHYIASPFWGGGEQYIYDLCTTLAETHQTRFVFVCQPGTDEQMQSRFRALGTVYTLQPRTKNSKFSYCEALRMASIIRHEKIDVVHMHDRKEFFLCAYAKWLCMRPVRLVATLHLVVSQAKSKPSWLWVYRQIDAMIFVSRHAADRFLALPAVRKACRHVHVIHNSIALPPATTLPQPDLREQCHISTGFPIVLYHGRICPEKGIISILQAIAPVFKRNYAIVLAGNIAEESREALEELLHHSALQGYLHYIGFRTDCDTLIRQSTVGLLPSLIPEAASLSLLEHMALGSAVLASNNGSQPEFVANQKEAILLPPGQWSLWIEALDHLITNQEVAQRLGQQAKKRFITEFGYPDFVEKIHRVYANQ
ncbi:MAG: glycosyltransferase family 4 protein [Paludibacteraceae bacterium]|nr:glycosyltransferase family 4 protein [Paludibacteraceae bacterium]